MIDTTDTDCYLSTVHPAASRADIDYVLDQVNRVLAVPLTRDDVEGVYAGLRPLLAGESDTTSKLSREHTVAHPVPGLVMIAGGKYTTYRLMARDAVDAVAHGLDGKVAPSCTDQIPLAGAGGFQALWNSRQTIARSSGLHVARIEHLLGRSGSLTGELPEMIASDPTLGKPHAGAEDCLRAEPPPRARALAQAAAWRAQRATYGCRAATRIRPCLPTACCPAFSRPLTRSIWATTSARSASGWRSRTATTRFTAWWTCTRSPCRRTLRCSAAGPGWRRPSYSPPAWTRSDAPCSCRVTFPSMPSFPGCSAA